MECHKGFERCSLEKRRAKWLVSLKHTNQQQVDNLNQFYHGKTYSNPQTIIGLYLVYLN